MESISEFLAMGGYAAYVWPCYGITAVVMVALLIGGLRAQRDQAARLQALQGDAGTAPHRNRGHLTADEA